MNLSNRIAKLEETAKLNGSGMCQCDDNFEFYHQDLTEDAATKGPVDGDGNPYVEGCRSCEKCGKEIERRVYIFQLCDASTPKELLRPDATPATFNVDTRRPSRN